MSILTPKMNQAFNLAMTHKTDRDKQQITDMFQREVNRAEVKLLEANYDPELEKKLSRYLKRIIEDQ